MIYSLVFVKQRRFLCLYPTVYQTMCYLGVAAKPASKQNACMCLLSVSFSLAISSRSLHFFSLSLSPCSSLLSTPFLSSSHLTFYSLSFLPLPVCLRRSSSRAWEKLTAVSPENLSESGERRGRWRASHSAHLLHTRHFGFSSCDRIRLVIYFSHRQ